jgi:hypothetical protein
MKMDSTSSTRYQTRNDAREETDNKIQTLRSPSINPPMLRNKEVAIRNPACLRESA